MNKKMREQFRDYDSDARPSVREFYRLNHQGQTLEFVRRKRKEHLGLNRCEMGIWEMAEYLNQLVDDSEMVASAKRRAEEIIREAEERAQKIVAAVEVDARGRRRGADEYVRDALAKLEGEVSEVLDTVRRGITAVTPVEEHLTPA